MTRNLGLWDGIPLGFADGAPAPAGRQSCSSRDGKKFKLRQERHFDEDTSPAFQGWVKVPGIESPGGTAERFFRP